MKEALVFISITSIMLIIFISCVRFFLLMIFSYKIKKYESLLNNSFNDNKENNKDYINKETYVGVQKMPKKFIAEETNYEKKEIVGVVKSVGKFTSMIIGQKITYMMQRSEQMKKRNSADYHVNTAYAHDISQGKGRGI